MVKNSKATRRKRRVGFFMQKSFLIPFQVYHLTSLCHLTKLKLVVIRNPFRTQITVQKQRKMKERLKMDTSSSILNRNEIGSISFQDYLLGGKTLKLTDIPVAEWVIIVRKIIDRCKPHLKYFDGFVPIGKKEPFERYWYQIVQWKNADLRMIFPDGVDWDTKIRSISQYADGLSAAWVPNFKLHSGEVIQKRDPFWSSQDFSANKVFLSTNLFLTSKGEILICESIHFESGEQDSIAQFSIVDDKKLHDLIMCSHGRITDLISVLVKALCDGIERRERQLSELRSLNETLEKISSICGDTRVFCSKCGGIKKRFGECPHCEIQPILL